MSAWLSIAVIAGAQVASQLICVAGAVWQERARARSACAQMEAAAASGTILVKRHQDGSVLVIMPGAAVGEQAVAAQLISGTFGGKSPR